MEWWRLRSEFQKQLSVPSNVRSFLPDVDEITREFVENLEANKVIDMMPELARLNLECKFEKPKTEFDYGNILNKF